MSRLSAPAQNHRPFWDEVLETQSRADRDARKLQRLQKHLHHAYCNSPFYRAGMEAAA